MRDLGGCPHGQLVCAGVVVGHDAPGLHGIGYEPLVHQLLLNDHVGLRGRLVAVSPTDLPLEGDVAGSVVVELRSALLHRVFHRDDGRKRLVVDIHQGGPIVGDGGIGGHYRSDGVAHVPDPPDRQRRMRHLLRVGHDPAHGKGAQLFLELLPGEDGDHALYRLGGGGVDAPDFGVSVRAPHDRHVEHAEELDVVDVVALPSDEARVLPALDAGSEHCSSHRLLLASPATALRSRLGVVAPVQGTTIT